MKGPETTVLNSVFVHTQYLLTVFSSNQDASSSAFGRVSRGRGKS